MARQFTNLNSDPELWHAFAGPAVQIPPANSLVYYFMQGHLDHCCSETVKISALGHGVKPPSRILCRVDSVNYLADPVTDQVFTKFSLTPLHNHHQIEPDDSLYRNPTRPRNQITLYPEHRIREKLERRSKLPPQTTQFTMKYDLHRNSWFCERRIGRSWIDMLNRKRVMKGDILLFLKDVRGYETYGVLRGRRTYPNCYGMDLPTVLKAIFSANRYMPFEVYYYPRIHTPEFVVNAARVEAAMKIQWKVRMRFTMEYEDERTSVLDMCLCTISSVGDIDHRNWPDSQWMRIQVMKEDKTEIRVNPWMLKPYMSDNASRFIALLEEDTNVNQWN